MHMAVMPLCYPDFQTIFARFFMKDSAHRRPVRRTIALVLAGGEAPDYTP